MAEDALVLSRIAAKPQIERSSACNFRYVVH